MLLGLGFFLRSYQNIAKDAAPSFSRQFSSSQAVFARRQQQSKIRILSKKAMTAKARRKSTILEKEDEKKEKHSLVDAINILRCVEAGSRKSCYELYIKTELGSGAAVPRGRVSLPREAKPKADDQVLVFAEGRQAEEAKRAGAHIVGGPELIDGILSKKYQAGTILCTTSLIKAITPRLGRYLGPLGMMPSERRGTVTDDIAGYVQRLQGTREWKADRTGNIRTPIATMDFPVEDVIRNIQHFMASVKKVTGNVKDTEKGKKSNITVVPIRKVMLSSRQGPGIRIADF